MTIAPAAQGLRLGLAPAHLAPAALRRSLAGAPIGQHPLVEAALAWQRLRPTVPGESLVATPPGNRSGYVPIVDTNDEDVAARVARLLSGLAFCVAGHTSGQDAARWQVDVPDARYRPVTRALTLVWRDTLRQFGPGAPMAGASREAAIALWRMAALIADGGPNPHLVTVGAGTPAAAGLLVAAATRLGVRATIQRVRRLPAVVVDDSSQVRLLLATLLRPNGQL